MADLNERKTEFGGERERRSWKHRIPKTKKKKKEKNDVI